MHYLCVFTETPDLAKLMEQEKESRVGETSVLKCLVSGSPPPELRWLKDSLPLEETVRHFLAADAQLLVIVDTVPSDAGTYTCEVTNAVGTRRGGHSPFCCASRSGTGRRQQWYLRCAV